MKELWICSSLIPGRILFEEHLLAHKQGCQIKIRIKIQAVLKWQKKDQIVYVTARKKTNFDSSHFRFTVHEFLVITQKIYFEPRIHQILPAQEGGRRFNIAFITKVCKDQAEKNGIAVFFFRGNFFGVSQSFLTPTNLKQALISEICPERANLGTLPTNFFLKK